MYTSKHSYSSLHDLHELCHARASPTIGTTQLLRTNRTITVGAIIGIDVHVHGYTVRTKNIMVFDITYKYTQIHYTAPSNLQLLSMKDRYIMLSIC